MPVVISMAGKSMINRNLGTLMVVQKQTLMVQEDQSHMGLVVVIHTDQVAESHMARVVAKVMDLVVVIRMAQAVVRVL